MNATSKMAPALRFPGFQSDWWEEPLHNLTEKSITYGIVQTGDAVEGGVKCVRVVDLTKPKIILDELITTTEEISNSYKRTILVEGEIMIALRGEIGLLALVPKNLEGSNLTRGIARVAPKRSAVHPEYLVWALRSDDGKMEFLKQVNGSALKEIPINGLNKVQVQLTSLAEQRKIADFLTAVDRRIQQLSQKKALLEDYKKGVMQQLFTQALRFKDDHGNEFPDWEEKPLGDVAEILNGYAFKSESFSKEEANKVIRMSDLKCGRIASEDHASVADCFVHGLERFALRDGDFLFGMSGSLSNFAWVSASDLPAYLNQRVGCLRQKYDNVARYAHYLFLSKQVQKKIEENAVGAAQLNISGVFLKELRLMIPHPAEQTKIANFLTALDRKIESVAQQITHTETFKKGLLQQMFV